MGRHRMLLKLSSRPEIEPPLVWREIIWIHRKRVVHPAFSLTPASSGPRFRVTGSFSLPSPGDTFSSPDNLSTSGPVCVLSLRARPHWQVADVSGHRRWQAWGRPGASVGDRRSARACRRQGQTRGARWRLSSTASGWAHRAEHWSGMHAAARWRGSSVLGCHHCRAPTRGPRRRGP